MTKIVGKKTNDGKRGGNLLGKPHDDTQGRPVGGIKAVVTDNNNQPVELEGGEVIINKAASKKHWKELSRINQSAGNGVPIGPPVDPHESDPDEYKKGGKIEFNPNKVPNKWILKYAENIKANHKNVWDLGGNIFGNEAFTNLKRVADRGYWLDSEKWMMIKWRSYVARHKKDFRIAGVIAMLKWVDKVDKGWPYMKQLIEAEIKKRSNKKKLGGKTSKKDEIECYSCSWSWDKADGGDDMYVCHNCGEDNEHKYKKGGKTHKEKYNTKYNHPKGESHSLKDISKETGVGMKGIQQIYNKGIGAYKTNPSSVRDNVKSKEQWAQARVYSAVTGGKAAKVDAKELKMETGGNITVNGDEYKVGDGGRWNGNKVLDIMITKITGSSVFFQDLTNYKDVRKKKVDFNKLYVPDGKMLPTKAQKKASTSTPKSTPKPAPAKKGPGKSWDSVLKYYQAEFKDVVVESVNSKSKGTFFNKGDNYTFKITRHTTKSFGVYFVNATMQEMGIRYNNADFKQKAEEFFNTGVWEFSSSRTGKVKLEDSSRFTPTSPTGSTGFDIWERFTKAVEGKSFECVKNENNNSRIFVGNEYVFKTIDYNRNTDVLKFDIYTEDSNSYCLTSQSLIKQFNFNVRKIEQGKRFVVWDEDRKYKLIFQEEVEREEGPDIKQFSELIMNKIWMIKGAPEGNFEPFSAGQSFYVTNVDNYPTRKEVIVIMSTTDQKDMVTTIMSYYDVDYEIQELTRKTNRTNYNNRLMISGTVFELNTIAQPPQPKAPAKKGPRKKFPEPKREPFNKKTDYFKLFKTYLGEGAKELTPTDVATKTNLAYLEIAKSPTKKADTLQLRFKSKSEYLEFLKLVDESEILNIVKDLKHSKKTKDWGVEMRIDELQNGYGNYIDGLKGDFPSIIIS